MLCGRHRPAAGLIDTFADQLGEDVDLPGDLIRLVRAMPSYYLRYFYRTEHELSSRRRTRRGRRR